MPPRILIPTRILIVGCGIAGPTLASFLMLSDMPAAIKSRITILERELSRTAHLRGQNIDIRGVGVTIMRKLGLEEHIRASTTGEEGVQIVDEQNRIWFQNQVDKTGKVQMPTSDIEILRGRFAELCWQNSQRVSAQEEAQGAQGIRYIFGDFLDEIRQDDEHVHVRFVKSKGTISYDLVIGADGMQSRTRKMVWGFEDDKDRLRPLGMYAVFFSISRQEHDGNGVDGFMPQDDVASCCGLIILGQGLPFSCTWSTIKIHACLKLQAKKVGDLISKNLYWQTTSKMLGRSVRESSAR